MDAPATLLLIRPVIGELAAPATVVVGAGQQA